MEFEVGKKYPLICTSCNSARGVVYKGTLVDMYSVEDSIPEDFPDFEGFHVFMCLSCETDLSYHEKHINKKKLKTSPPGGTG